MNLYLRNLVDYTQEFGLFSAFLLIIQRKLHCKIIRIKPKGIKHWIHCRNGTSDFAVLRQVIGKKECAFELKQTPKNIIDAGANVGYASILFANIWKNASIVAVEPEEENFKMLLKNTASYPNIKCLRAAIWSKKCRLEVENVNAAAFSFQFHESQNDGNAKIDSVTINEIKSYFPNNNVDLLKIDIEGGELEIFKNSEQGWEEGISFIAVELHERYAKGVTDIVLDKMKNRECKIFGEYYTFFYT